MYIHGMLAVVLQKDINGTDIYEVLQQVRGEEIMYKPKYKTIYSIFFKYIQHPVRT
jgi:hypothetical protein